MKFFTFGHASRDAVGAGFSSTPTFDKWSGAPGLFTSRPQIDFLDQAIAASDEAAVSGDGQEVLAAQQSLQQTAERSLANMAAKQKLLESKFDKPLSGAELFQLADLSFRTVAEMQRRGKELPSLFDDEKQKLKDYGVRLVELRAMARLLRDKPNTLSMIKLPVAPGSEWSNEFKKNVIAPYVVASLSLKKAVGAYADRASNVAVLSSAPHKVVQEIGNIAHTAIEQVPKALGLPGWFVPVLAGAVAVGVAANAVGKVNAFTGRKGVPA